MKGFIITAAFLSAFLGAHGAYAGEVSVSPEGTVISREIPAADKAATVIAAIDATTDGASQLNNNAALADESPSVVVIVPGSGNDAPATETAGQSEQGDDAVTADNEDISLLAEADLSQIEEPKFDIPITLNEKVDIYIRYFTVGIRDRFSVWLARSERYLPIMKDILRENELPEDLAYIALIESGFNPKATSRAKAVGPWQFMKATGKRYGLKVDRWVDERRDPEKATVAAAEYLKDLYGMFDDWYLAAAGYNAGEGKIKRAISRYKTNDFWELSDRKYRYLKRETKDYVPKLIAAALIAKEPAKYGFEGIEYNTPLVYEEVSVNGMRDMKDIANASGCDLEDLRLLNPELKTSFTPPYSGYILKVPVGKRDDVVAAVAQIRPLPSVTEYVVRRGDTLSQISQRFGVEISEIAKTNNISRAKLIRPGDSLLIPRYAVSSDDQGKRPARKKSSIRM